MANYQIAFGKVSHEPWLINSSLNLCCRLFMLEDDSDMNLIRYSDVSTYTPKVLKIEDILSMDESIFWHYPSNSLIFIKAAIKELLCVTK